MPEAMAANANLFVSAENSQFENYISAKSKTKRKILKTRKTIQLKNL
jgi:hypothetical protein